jgi:hypothetical protein
MAFCAMHFIVPVAKVLQLLELFGEKKWATNCCSYTTAALSGILLDEAYAPLRYW